MKISILRSLRQSCLLTGSNGKIPDLDAFLRARRSSATKPSIKTSKVEIECDNDIENSPVPIDNELKLDSGKEAEFKRKMFLAKRRKSMSPGLRLQTMIKDSKDKKN